MKSLTLVIAAVVSVGLFIAAGDPRPGAPDATKEGDEKTIRALLHDLGEEWNKHEMKEFTARMGENADAVNRFGQWMKGRAAIREHLITLHGSPIRPMLESRSSKIEQVRFLTPDVALAHELTDEKTGKSVRTYVLQKRDGQWWIESADIVQQGQALHP
ncbi:MAG TPA: SgcJ/EcaC family oxidoreductase [Isosphaeraceae bacterium]|nr:SgcJ/EcaC family oxidoreductase [Isosphaeraceae bacterium]